MKQTYRVTRPDIEWIAGRRVDESGAIELTAEEAEADLARSNIELSTDDARAMTKGKARTPDQAAG